jgi:hypothetical protein
MKMHCTYKVAYCVQGVLLPAGQILHLLPGRIDGVWAVLTNEPDSYLYEHDLALKIAEALLAGLFAAEAISDLDNWLANKIGLLQQSRKDRFGNRPYLIFGRESDEDVTLDLHREFDTFVVCFDAIDKRRVQQESAAMISRLLASVALHIGDVDGYDKVAESVTLKREDGKTVFTFSPSAGGVKVITENIPTDIQDKISASYDAMEHNPVLERTINLMSFSVEQHQNRFRAFVASWTAMELLVNKLFPDYERGLFGQLTDTESEAERSYFARISEVMRDKYRLLDKFALVALSLSPDTADGDLQCMKQIVEIRNDLVHKHSVRDEQLPLESLQQLLRKYMAKYLDVTSLHP